MKKRLIIFILITLLAASTISIFDACASAAEESKGLANRTIREDTLYLLRGNISDTFDFVMKQKSIDAKTLFTYEKNILNLSANVIGYMRTKAALTNYKLHVEWLWQKNMSGANSGILVHIQPPDSVWPRCVQAQLKQEKAGDLIAMAGAKFKEALGKPKDTAEKLAASNEKPAGEWNNSDIVSENDSLIVYVNGTLQNKATQMNITAGAIGFQMEGKLISFRNIYLIKL